MPTVAESNQIIAKLTGHSVGEIAKVARRLIDARLLPKSSGRDIKDVTSAQFLVLLGTVALSRKPVFDVETATELTSLPYAGEGCEEYFFPSFVGSRLTFTNSEARPEILDADTLLQFHRRPSGMAISFREVTPEFVMRHQFWHTQSWGGYTSTTFTVSNEGVHFIARQFAQDALKEGEFITRHSELAEDQS